MSRVLALVVVCGCLALGSTQAAPQVWYIDYAQALEAIEKERHENAERILRELIQRLVVPRESARTYGAWRTDYTPYYHLGIALAEQGKHDEALKSFEVGLKFGVVQRDPERVAVIDGYRRRPGSDGAIAAAAGRSEP